MSEGMKQMSQVQVIGEARPKSWDDYERGCLLTYSGGHRGEFREAFHHGMQTVFNILRGEFPPAQQCHAAPELLAAIEAAMRIETLWGPRETTDPQHLEENQALDSMRQMFIAAIHAARPVSDEE